MVVQSNIHKYTWNSSGKHTVGLITYWYIGECVQVYFTIDIS
jgi:hypothetical protein